MGCSMLQKLVQRKKFPWSTSKKETAPGCEKLRSSCDSVDASFSKFPLYIYIYVYTFTYIYIYKPTVHGRGVNKMGFQLPLPASTWLLSLDPKTKLRVSTKQPTSFKEGHHLGGWGLVAIC